MLSGKKDSFIFRLAYLKTGYSLKYVRLYNINVSYDIFFFLVLFCFACSHIFLFVQKSGEPSQYYGRLILLKGNHWLPLLLHRMYPFRRGNYTYYTHIFIWIVPTRPVTRAQPPRKMKFCEEKTQATDSNIEAK